MTAPRCPGPLRIATALDERRNRAAKPTAATRAARRFPGPTWLRRARIASGAKRAWYSRDHMTVRRHVFVCANARPDGGRPSCSGRGGAELCRSLTRAVLARGLGATVAVTTSGCLGPCFDGPNLVIYPDGIWYQAVELGDVDGIVEHLAGGAPLSHRLAHRDD